MIVGEGEEAKTFRTFAIFTYFSVEVGACDDQCEGVRGISRLAVVQSHNACVKIKG